MKNLVVLLLSMLAGCVEPPPSSGTTPIPDAGSSDLLDARGMDATDTRPPVTDLSADFGLDAASDVGNIGDASRDASDVNTDGGDAATTEDTGSDDASMRTRLPLTITAGTVATDLPDFPLLVDIEHPSIANALSQPGRPFAFSADGEDLPFEIEVVTPSGRMRAWVLVPMVYSGSDSVIYLEFEERPTNPRAVWNDYGGVWHFHPLGQNTTSYRDSTANQNSGTPIGNAPTSGGKIGLALLLDGSTQWVEVPDAPSLRPSTFTLSAWVNLDNKGAGVGPVSKPMSIDNWDSYQLWVTAGFQFLTWIVHDGLPAAESGGTFSAGTWTHLANTFDGTDMVHYIDGVEVYRYQAAGSPGYDENSLFIGADIDYGTMVGLVQGRIDEARLANQAFPPERIAAEHANQNAPGSFVNVGTPESY